MILAVIFRIMVFIEIVVSWKTTFRPLYSLAFLRCPFFYLGIEINVFRLYHNIQEDSSPKNSNQNKNRCYSLQNYSALNLCHLKQMLHFCGCEQH